MGKLVPQAHGIVEGKSTEEFFALVRGSLEGLAQINLSHSQAHQEELASAATSGFHVLARARRARKPGIVFARAALNSALQEPLIDADSRLFVGLSAERS
jgi:hypothetical protein